MNWVVSRVAHSTSHRSSAALRKRCHVGLLGFGGLPEAWPPELSQLLSEAFVVLRLALTGIVAYRCEIGHCGAPVLGAS